MVKTPKSGSAARSSTLRGSAARSSATGKPIVALLDLLGRRWALRILYELRGEIFTFRVLQARCGNPSPSVLNHRMKQLSENGLVDLSDGEGYCLTRLGEDLATHLLPLVRWSERWAGALAASRRG